MTRATDEPTGRRSNRLATEKSPYLLQHAGNPVDWFPWGSEAFAEARRRDLPIFLSIGYSTCHWCHVMEEESFEDAATAAILNERFVSVKLDREERPDVDDHYMQAVVAMTGAGGWPMTVFLDHELRPFFGGTYFPPEDRWGRPGFRTLLLRISELWGSRRDEVLESGRQLDEELRRAEAGAGPAGSPPDAAAVVDRAVGAWHGRFDSARGGFGGAPKFPPHLALDTLLRHAARTGDPRSRTMAERTLDAMAAGGIHDQVGGGFHRYSTDADWLVPHFEKMLYDNALLAAVYLDAARLFARPDFERVARRTLDWILRDMTAPDGGFLSARDADDPGGEGSHYVWTPSQLRELLGDDDAALVAARFGVDEAGNFEVEGSRAGDRPPRRGSILSLRATVDELARRFSLSGDEVARRLDAAAERMREARSLRPAPSTDDKVLTDWNGLAISAFAAGWRVTRDPRYLRAAERAAGFLLGAVRRDGGLLHRWREGDAAIPGFLTDWAFLAQGLLDLGEASLEPRWFLEADDLAREAVRRFGDGEGRFFLTEGPGEIGRRVAEDWDGAIPTGASILLGVLVRLAAMRGEPEGGEVARALLSAMATRLDRQPTALARALSALEWRSAGGRVVVLAGARGTPAMDRFHERLFERGPLGAIVVPADASLAERFPVIGGKGSPPDGVLAYVCRDLACEAPTGDPEALARALAGAPVPRRETEAT